MRTTRSITLSVFCLCSVLGLGSLSACGDSLGDKELSFPQRQEQVRNQKRGKLTGDGLSLGGPADESEEAGKNPLGVNAFLWRATLDTIAFMPLRDADPFGGVVITDWYEDPQARGVRYKINALILDRTLRADGIKIALFKQERNEETGEWSDAEVPSKLERQLEDTILTRARELRVNNL